jgi:SAM-dependent methyltransferase
MSADNYTGAARRWAEGASLVYRPIAEQLLTISPHPLRGRVVLDAGAGTGVASTALARIGARPVEMDLSLDMLAWDASHRPPAVVADVTRLPLGDGSIDDIVAAFVYNHLTCPELALAEAVRVTRPGGALLACVYSNTSHSEVRDAIDEAARGEGWCIPAWYLEIKQTATPLLVDERAVDVGVTKAEQLVDYRLGQAHFAGWLNSLDPGRVEEIRDRLVDLIRPVMVPYRPIVVFLSALVL